MSKYNNGNKSGSKYNQVGNKYKPVSDNQRNFPCPECGTVFDTSETNSFCPECGQNVKGLADVQGWLKEFNSARS